MTPLASPRDTIPRLVFSRDAAVVSEALVTLLTGFPFPAGSLATSGTQVLANLYGPSITIDFLSPVNAVAFNTVGEISGSAVGSVLAFGFFGATLVSTASSDPTALGDSGAPEALLLLNASQIDRLVLTSTSGRSASFVIDDLEYTVVPEPGGLALYVGLFLALLCRRSPQQV